MSDFNSRFGLAEPDQNEIKQKFLSRVNSLIFSWLNNDAEFKNSDIVEFLSLELGESWDEVFKKDSYGRRGINLNSISKNNFFRTLRIIEECYKFILSGGVKNNNPHVWDHTKRVTVWNFNSRIEKIFVLSEANIGIFWKDGKFYKSGAKELDKKLIEDPLDWLSKYPKVKERFDVSLDYFKKSQKNKNARKDSITNAYSAIESLSKEVLKNKKNFEKNSNLIVDYLNLPNEYKNIFHYYKQIAHEYSSRHSGSEFEHVEAEAFIYLTGLLIRLILQK